MLREYQQFLYKKVWTAFREGYKRPLVVAPCGAGKSYIFLEMVKHCTGNVLVLTHRRELQRQHQELFKQNGVTNVRVEMIITEANHLGERTRPRMLILDEAHLSRSASWEKVVEYYDTATVGFTATPVRLDGLPLGQIFDYLVQGVTVPWLIQNNYLAPFDYYAPMTVDVSKARVTNGEFVLTDLAQIMSNRAIYGDVIRAYRKFARGQKAIAYCVSVDHAKIVAEMFRKEGIAAVHVSADTPTVRRDEIMAEFRNGTWKVLCNVGIISEGISIDDVYCCMLLRPTQSHALYWQQAMRCMRYKVGKRAMILDFVGNYTRNPMPDDEVIWSLNEAPKKPARLTAEGNFTVRVCPECRRTFKTRPVCPYCGSEYPLSKREIEAHQEIELKRIEQEDKERIEQEKKLMRQEVGRAKTYPELLQIARQRGYNPAWARMVWQGRHHR